MGEKLDVCPLKLLEVGGNVDWIKNNALVHFGRWLKIYWKIKIKGRGNIKPINKSKIFMELLAILTP